MKNRIYVEFAQTERLSESIKLLASNLDLKILKKKYFHHFISIDCEPKFIVKACQPNCKRFKMRFSISTANKSMFVTFDVIEKDMLLKELMFERYIGK